MSRGYFSGDPKCVWITDSTKADRSMRLLAAFSFTDPFGKNWPAFADDIIDGASIPRPLWSLVGSPYTGDYRRASVVHDKACVDAGGNSGARRAADRMFYHACRAGGCSIRAATLLYIGVRIGAMATIVAAWREAPNGLDEPRLARSAADARLEADFRLIGEQVEPGEVDDIFEIEARTDEAIKLITGVDLKGK